MGARGHRRSWRRVVAIAVTILVVGCGGPDASHYAAVLDELAVPAEWELAQEFVSEPGIFAGCASILPECPSVTRYYFAPGLPVDAYPIAKQMLTSAGFAVDLDTGPACDSPPGGSACSLGGNRDDDGIGLSIYVPGSDVELEDEPADRTIVVIGSTGH